MDKKNIKKEELSEEKEEQKKAAKEKKRAFTLIELLAVIIILGILMIVAIPAVTSYINSSRKSAYVDTAKEISDGTKHVVNEGKLGMYDTDTTYYIESGYIKTENASKSPYGDFEKAYIIVTYDGKGYTYYWTSVDETGTGVKGIVRVDQLNEDDIESDIKLSEIEPNVGIGTRSNIKIIRADGSIVDGYLKFRIPESGAKWGEIATSTATPTTATTTATATGTETISNIGVTIDGITYPYGKTKDTVVTGDLVTIGTEEFFVVKHDGNDLILLSHFNLKVGNIYNYTGGKTGEYTNSDYGYGRQSSETTGSTFLGDSSYYRGTMKFSNTYYWNEKVGIDYPGIYCNSNTYTTGTNCAYVYDSNSNLKTYVDNYKIYLEEQGATIKSARLLRVEEAFELGCGKGQWSCKDSPANAPSWVYETSYWLGSAYDTTSIWNIGRRGVFNYGHETYGYYYGLGIRPVIVI